MTTPSMAWMPQACTLPMVQRPLRVAEFDRMIAAAVRSQRRLSPTKLRWELDPAVEQTARDLADRESSCCSFFSFTFTRVGDRLRLDVQVPAAQAEILDALATRASAGLAT